MSDIRQTLAVVGFAAATLASALYGPSHGSPDPAVMLTIMVAALTAGIAGLAFSAICGAVPPTCHRRPDPGFAAHVGLQLCQSDTDGMDLAAGRPLAGGWAASSPAGQQASGPGVWVLTHVEQRLITNGIGVILLAYATNLVIGKLPRVTVEPRSADAAVGFAAGAIGAVAALPSLPVTIWWPATRLREGQAAGDGAAVHPGDAGHDAAVPRRHRPGGKRDQSG